MLDVAGQASSSRVPLFRRLWLHGLGVEITCAAPGLMSEIDRLMGIFAVPRLPAGFITHGSIQRFEQAEVLRHVSSAARRVGQVDPWLELYEDGERFWLLDERWGIAEMNMLKGQWRSWILDGASADPPRLAEGAVLWPMAQLLRYRGLHLVPAASAARDGFGVLLLASFSIAQELMRLAEGGYRIIAQRWTAIRCESDRVELLHMPGRIERPMAPRLRAMAREQAPAWMDLAEEFPSCAQARADCRIVIIADAARRTDVHAEELAPISAHEALRQAWPMVDLHPARRSGQLFSRMAQNCRCVRVQLSRRPEGLLALLESLRAESSGGGTRVESDEDATAERRRSIA